MPEEAASPDLQEEYANQTPANESGSETGTPATDSSESHAPDQNWEQRYQEAQAWGTRASQEAAQYRQIIDLARQGDPEALEFLGYEVPADTEDKNTEEPDLSEQLQQLRQMVETQQQTAQEAQQQAELQQAADAFYAEEFSKLDPENKWSQEYRNLVAAAGDQHVAEDGLPDLQKAHEAIQSQFEELFKQRVAAKRSPQAPSGASPSHNPDLSNPEDRQAYMAQRLMEQDANLT